jgi:hypothetical protein
MEARLSNIQANNDVSERKIAMIRYLRCSMQRLRVAGKEALILLKINKPLVELKAGRLGSIPAAFAYARQRRANEAKARGTGAAERLRMIDADAKYREVEAKPSTGAAAVTRRENANKAAALLEQFKTDPSALLVGLTKAKLTQELQKLKVEECNLLMAAWKLFGDCRNAEGGKFSFKFRTEGTGASNKQGKRSLKVGDKRQGLYDCINYYVEHVQAAAPV